MVVQGWSSGGFVACYFPELMQPAWRGNALWSASYFAGSVGGAPLDVVRRYIESKTGRRKGAQFARLAIPPRTKVRGISRRKPMMATSTQRGAKQPGQGTAQVADGSLRACHIDGAPADLAIAARRSAWASSSSALAMITRPMARPVMRRISLPPLSCPSLSPSAP